MPDFRIEIRGLRDFSRELKHVDQGFGKELRQANLKIAELVEARVHSRMSAGGSRASKARKGVKGKATQKGAVIRTTANPEFTLGVIGGMRRRSGWFAARRYHGLKSNQFEPWVGNQWDPGETGGKPYFVGAAINESIDEAIDLYGDAVDEMARRAGFK